jgi:ribosomal protein S18 acetylase RimI-like enzyme
MMPGHWKAVVELDKAAFEGSHQNSIKRGDLKNAFIQQSMCGWVLDETGPYSNKIVSYVVWRFDGRNDMSLVRIATDPEHKGKGYASLLLLDGLGSRPRSIRRINAYVHADNVKALEYITSLGFKYEGPEPDYFGGAGAYHHILGC